MSTIELLKTKQHVFCKTQVEETLLCTSGLFQHLSKAALLPRLLFKRGFENVLKHFFVFSKLL